MDDINVLKVPEMSDSEIAYLLTVVQETYMLGAVTTAVLLEAAKRLMVERECP